MIGGRSLAPLSYLESLVDMYSPEKTGLDAICRRLREGRKVCVEVAHYFRLRSKAEYEYTKALFNCSKTIVLKGEASVFDAWWSELRTQTEVTANAHSDAGDHYNSLADELVEFSDDQSKLAQLTEETIKRGSAIEKAEFRKALVYRSYYEDKMKQSAAASEAHNHLTRFVTTPKKDLEKSKLKTERLQKEKEAAGTAYDKAVERFVLFCKNWEPRMEKSFKDLEDLEISRLQTLRNKMWKSTNIDSLTALRHDECCEKVRQNLEQCDIFADLKSFIQKKRSLSENSDTSSSSTKSSSSSGRPVAQSTPKPRRQWFNLHHKRPNLVIDEHGYASADVTQSTTSSVRDYSKTDSEADTLSAACSQRPPSVFSDTDTTVFDDCGYASVKDVHRQSVATLTENTYATPEDACSSNPSQGVPIPNAIPEGACGSTPSPGVPIPDNYLPFSSPNVTTWKGPAGSGNTSGDTRMSLPDVQIPSSDQVQQNTQGGQNELDLTVTSALTEGVCGSSSTSDVPNPNNLSISTDAETWRDDFGYASVKDIRRRKHTAQTEFKRNSLTRKKPPSDDYFPPKQPPRNLPKTTETDTVNSALDKSHNESMDAADSRSTWL